MKSKLEIMTQVMLSLRGDQGIIMDNINALLANNDKEQDVIPRIKDLLRELSIVHAEMQECEAFILQLTKVELEKEERKDKTRPGEFGSSGEFNNDEPSQK
jgi:hypothetical protein